MRTIIGSVQEASVKVHNLCIMALFILATAKAQPQSFTSIEVRPAASSSVETRRVRVLPNGEVIATSVNVAGLFDFAYDVPTNPSERLSTLPEWAFTQRYDITAKTAGKTQVQSAEAVSGRTVKNGFQIILKERFHLTMRMEEKTMAVYTLIVAPNGAKVKAAEKSDCIYDTAPSGCHTFPVGFGHPLNGHAVTMDDLAHYIENWTDLPVVNKTGLNGLYFTTSEGWLPMRLPPPPPNGNGNVDFTRLNTIDAVLEGLGLRLQKESATLPGYTIQTLEQPSHDQ